MFVNAVVMDVLICTYIETDDAIASIKKALKRHLYRAKKTGKVSEVINALEAGVVSDVEEPRLLAKQVIDSITDNSGIADAYLDIFELWSALIKQDFDAMNEWNRPWIVDASFAEKFKGGKRYIYSGERNQLYAAIGVAKSGVETNFSGVLVTEAKVKKILESAKTNLKVEDFAPLCHFSSPTATGVDAPNVDSSSNGQRGFYSFPVWAVETFNEYLSAREVKLLNKMVTRREKELRGFEPTSQVLMDCIQNKVSEQRKAHKIDCRFDKASAYYSVTQDYIAMPKPTQFNNELEYYSTWVHELAHSTAKFLGRSKKHDKKGEGFVYAFEEVCAETTTFLAIKRLQREVSDMGLMTDEIRVMFEDCFKNNEAYVRNWGMRVSDSFSELLKSKYRSYVFSGLIKDVFACHVAVSTGTNFGKDIVR